MPQTATTMISTDPAEERALTCNSALAEIDYMNFYMEQRVTACVLRMEKACGDMLKSLDLLDRDPTLLVKV